MWGNRKVEEKLQYKHYKQIGALKKILRYMSSLDCRNLSNLISLISFSQPCQLTTTKGRKLYVSLFLPFLVVTLPNGCFFLAPLQTWNINMRFYIFSPHSHILGLASGPRLNLIRLGKEWKMCVKQHRDL